MRTAIALLALLVAAPAMALSITSPAFPNGGPIPTRFTCEGVNVSPPLQFSGVPKAAKGFALVVTDPDAPDPAAPQTTFTHWELYDIPAGTHGLAEAADSQLPAGTRAGTNDFGKTRWGGPCPPVGRHRYFFRLYALDVALGNLKAPTREALEKAIDGHVLQEAETMGTYEKSGRK